MAKLPSTPLELSSTPAGFSIVNTDDLTSIAASLVSLHIEETLGQKFDSLENAAQFVIENDFFRFKDKPARIFAKPLAAQFVDCLKSYRFLNAIVGDFVTDEEGLGYENIYWRIVRSNSPSDVGPIHADRWFWELSQAPFPTSYSRVKVWMPLIQDDENPSLMILPESQERQFNYKYHSDSFGKKKPIFLDDLVTSAMITAPVRVGEAIIFHDGLLHGGKATGKHRVSLEFTLGSRVI